MTDAPLLALPRTPASDDRLAKVPVGELKQHLLLYLPSPPGPKTAARVLEAYFDLMGDRFVELGSTAYGSERRRWNPTARGHFMRGELPRLRTRRDWGYSWSDGLDRGSWVLMLHGFRPVSEPDMASVLRFEFDWQLDPEALWRLAETMLGIVECTSANAGYVFQGQPRGPHGRESWNTIFAWARRYWGVEVQDLDVTVAHALQGIKCVSWATAVGPSLSARDPAALEQACGVATAVVTASGGTLLRAGATPVLGDRNRREDLSRYEALAQALAPLQLTGHGSFAPGYQSRWDEEITQAWLRRFTAPDDFANA